MKIYNSKQNKLIFGDIKIADNLFTRTIGLISKKSLDDGEGLLIKPCCSIHTFFMKFNIDVVFLDSKNQILAIYENVTPFKVLPIHITACYVLELKAGEISKSGLGVGDEIFFE